MCSKALPINQQLRGFGKTVLVFSCTTNIVVGDLQWFESSADCDVHLRPLKRVDLQCQVEQCGVDLRTQLGGDHGSGMASIGYTLHFHSAHRCSYTVIGDRQTY